MKKLLIGALITLASTSSFAAGTWSTMGKVEASYVDMRTTAGRALIKHQAARADSCTNNGNLYHLDLSHASAQHAYSLILSAEARRVDVRFYHDGCSTDGFPVIKIASTY